MRYLDLCPKGISRVEANIAAWLNDITQLDKDSKLLMNDTSGLAADVLIAEEELPQDVNHG
jgi:hypothetical protein